MVYDLVDDLYCVSGVRGPSSVSFRLCSCTCTVTPNLSLRIPQTTFRYTFTKYLVLGELKSELFFEVTLPRNVWNVLLGLVPLHLDVQFHPPTQVLL